MGDAIEVKLDGKDYVILILPKKEYLRQRGGVLAEAVDALDHARRSLAGDLRAAREHAGLTQTQLARKLRKSQTMVSQAESGQVSVGERYVAAVLRACGLPKEWKPSSRRQSARKEPGQGVRELGRQAAERRTLHDEAVRRVARRS